MIVIRAKNNHPSLPRFYTNILSSRVEFNLQESLLSSLALPYVVTISVKAPASVPFHLGLAALFFSAFFYKRSDSFNNLDKSFAAYLNQPPAFPKLPGKYNETPEALKPSV